MFYAPQSYSFSAPVEAGRCSKRHPCPPNAGQGAGVSRAAKVGAAKFQAGFGHVVLVQKAQMHSWGWRASEAEQPTQNNQCCTVPSSETFKLGRCLAEQLANKGAGPEVKHATEPIKEIPAQQQT